ncbi:hypothetical protein GCM10010441_75720 [Kitasatospora paracochleata]|uniref:Uncharacterized protein n=1 Tax=Kitasatospora paracochleata TaxID=58354 RepID=A0ABT1J9Z9_9ACTN|nr:hypothetical protein [Kitasatospora paracochleata]MCP2314285.1 hypothetical protein [Kitasatospora paracochleata]
MPDNHQGPAVYLANAEVLAMGFTGTDVADRGTDPETDAVHGLVASRLLAADWRHWPAPERDALEGVWRAWWQSALHHHPAGQHITDVLETVSVGTGALAPWLAIWSATRTETADRHLADALDSWLRWGELADLHLGFYNELHATPELLPWLLSLENGRIHAAQLVEIEHIAYR